MNLTSKQLITLAAVALIAVAIGTLVGNRHDRAKDQTVAQRIETDPADHSHSQGEEGHAHAVSATEDHSHEGVEPRSVVSSIVREGQDEEPETAASRLERAMASRQRILEENQTILNELLSSDEVRALYQEKLENPDLTLYDDQGNRLSEEEFIATWIANNGIKTPEMEATMEASAWAPVQAALAKERAFSLGGRDEQSDSPDANSGNSAESPAELQERLRQIRRQEAEVIRAELLTRPQIEALYDQKVSEHSPEVLLPDGGVVSKDVFVRQFVESYGELTPELNQVLDEYQNR